MPEQLLKQFSIEIQQKLYEKNTPKGQLAVYQTTPFGMMLTLNEQVVMSEYDNFFYHEMMTHPALFTHPQPEKIAILGNTFGILQEVIKHTTVREIVCVDNDNHLKDAISQYFPVYAESQDSRIKQITLNRDEWLTQCEPDAFDIIIQADHCEDMLEENFKHYFRALRTEGILMQPCVTSLLQLNKTLKPIYQNVRHAGFHDWQMLNFPQPSFGWRTVMMATKGTLFKQVREKDVYNKPFSTQYYNFDVHKAALVLPEFARVGLGK